MTKRLMVLALPLVAAGCILTLPGSASAASAALSISPATGLSNGQTVKVTGSGFPAAVQLFVLQCAPPASKATCDVGGLRSVVTSATGTFSTTVKVVTGKVGTGTCDAGRTCSIAASEISGKGAEAKITFKGAGTDGEANDDGVPVTAWVLGAVGAVALTAGGLRLRRR